MIMKAEDKHEQGKPRPDIEETNRMINRLIRAERTAAQSYKEAISRVFFGRSM